MTTMTMQPHTQMAMQQRVRQAGVNESRNMAVGSPVGLGGPELQLYLGPGSPHSPQGPGQWGPGQMVGGKGGPTLPPQAFHNHPMGSMDWEAQVATIVQEQHGPQGNPALPGGQAYPVGVPSDLRGPGAMMQMGTSYASAQMQAGPWGGTNGMIGFQSQQQVGYCSPAGHGQPLDKCRRTPLSYKEWMWIKNR
jgi:hypothetical protein